MSDEDTKYGTARKLWDDIKKKASFRLKTYTRRVRSHLAQLVFAPIPPKPIIL